MTTTPYQTLTSAYPASGYGPWMTLICGIIISGAITAFSGNDLGPKILALILLWLFAGMSCKFELSHPYVWYGLFYVLYGISAPVLVYYDIHPFGRFGGLDPMHMDFAFVLDLEFLGLVTALVVIGPRSANLAAGMQDPAKNVIFLGVVPVLILSAAVLGSLLWEVYSQGFAGKGDVTLYGSFLTRLGFSYNLVVFSAVVLAFRYFSDDAAPKAYLLIAIVCTLALMSVFVSGQRNFLFRFVLSTVFLIHLSHRRVSWVWAVVMMVPAFVLIYWLGEQKMSWVDAGASAGAAMAQSFGNQPDDLYGLGQKYLAILQDPPMLRYFKMFLITSLGTEFLTASNNLGLIVERVPYDLPYLNGSTMLFSDIARGILPGFLLGDSVTTSTSVYHNAFFPESVAKGVGPGFSMLGAGYMNFGVAGVVLIMAIFGLALRFIYHWAEKSALGFLFFVGFIPIAAYSTRVELTAPLSQGLKHVFLPLVAMMFIGALRLRRAYVPDRRTYADRRADGSLPSRHGGRERRGQGDDRRSVMDRRRRIRTSPSDRSAEEPNSPRIPENPD